MHIQVRVPTTPDPVLAPVVAVLARARRRQREMLQAHYRAAGRRLTATGLAQAAGCRHYAYANRWYGQMGRELYGVAPSRIDRWTAAGAPVFTTMLATDVTKPGDVERVWELRPEVARAVEMLGWS
jgi:hypothetical protein